MKYHIELDSALLQLAAVFDKAELTLYLSGESLRAKILGQTWKAVLDSAPALLKILFKGILPLTHYIMK